VFCSVTNLEKVLKIKAKERRHKNLIILINPQTINSTVNNKKYRTRFNGN